MLDIKKIRANPEKVLKDLSNKDKDINLKSILSTDTKLKSLTTKLNDLQAKQNSRSKEIGQLKSKRDSSDDVFKDLKVLSEKIKEHEKEQKELSLLLKNALLEIPNLPHYSCPVGKNEKDNIIVLEKKKKENCNFPLKDHTEIGKKLDILDFETSAKMSGTGFPLFKGKGA